MTFDPKDYVRTNFPQTEARLGHPMRDVGARLTRENYYASVKRRVRRNKVVGLLGALGLLVLIGGLIIGLWLLASWYLMIGIGIAHAEWWHTIPTMSFHAALLIDIFIGGWIGGQVTVSRALSKKK